MFAIKGISNTAIDDIVTSCISKVECILFRTKEEINLEIAEERLKQRNSIDRQLNDTISSKKQ